MRAPSIEIRAMGADCRHVDYGRRRRAGPLGVCLSVCVWGGVSLGGRSLRE